ncbi:MAG: LysM peptidoglycan-binding domain-containing protein [Actinobacteria bacterium]|nr:LysM peptidoglycan-binding domain-containing protein [Actinomycetota bacterium]
MAARVAAPVVFLVAVIALIGIVVNSGVLGGGGDATPGSAATATQSGGGAQTKTKKYVVHEGDSLSSIADRFGTTTTRLMELNPDLNGTTVVVGQRIVVPAKQ